MLTTFLCVAHTVCWRRVLSQLFPGPSYDHQPEHGQLLVSEIFGLRGALAFGLAARPRRGLPPVHVADKLQDVRRERVAERKVPPLDDEGGKP